jgi:hypothetical protein
VHKRHIEKKGSSERRSDLGEEAWYLLTLGKRRLGQRGALPNRGPVKARVCDTVTEVTIQTCFGIVSLP